MVELITLRATHRSYGQNGTKPTLYWWIIICKNSQDAIKKSLPLLPPFKERNDNFVFNGLLWEQNVMKRRGVIRFYTQHNMATDSTEEKWNLDPVTHGISLIEQLTTNVCESARKDSGKRLQAQPALNHTFMHPPFPKEIFHPYSSEIWETWSWEQTCSQIFWNCEKTFHEVFIC